MLKFLKAIISSFIVKLASESDKAFGSKRLDCCTLDRPEKIKM